MTESTALETRDVAFYDDLIVAVQHNDAIYVLFSRVCDNIGRPRNTETRRVENHLVLQKGLLDLPIQTTGGTQTLKCLRLDLVPLWLATIPSKQIKDAVKPKLERYQTEAADVLWKAFKQEIIVAEPAFTDLPISTDAELAQLQQLAELGRAITRMAEEQFEQRRRMDAAARAFQGMRRDITDVQVRLDILEDRLTPASVITDVQAAEVSNRVKALAELLTTKDTSKNHYQAIFSELYRRFSVSSYKLIQQVQYEDVLAFLEAWRVRFAAE